MLKPQRGFNIIEMMVVVALGLILMGLVFSTYIADTDQAGGDAGQGRVNIVIFNALNQMSAEIARASSWNIATAVQDWSINYTITLPAPGTMMTMSIMPAVFPSISSSTNVGPLLVPVDPPSSYTTGLLRITAYTSPASSATTQVITTFNGGPPPTVTLPSGSWGWVNPFGYDGDATNKFQLPSSDCILFTYDKSGTGVMNTSSNSDRFGYILSNVGGVGVIQVRTGGTTFNCTPGPNNTWENLTDPNEVNVTQLQFSDATQTALANGQTITFHNITVTITANLISNSNITATQTSTIVVRNATSAL